MEEYFSTLLLLTFFNGGLAITIVYYFIAIQKVKVAYEAMLESQSSLQNQQTVQNTMLREKADDLDMLILDIQSKMDEDNYADLSKINAKVRTLETVLESHARSWQMEQAFEKKVQESLTNIKQWMKKMGDDPTLIRGY